MHFLMDAVLAAPASGSTVLALTALLRKSPGARRRHRNATTTRLTLFPEHVLSLSVVLEYSNLIQPFPSSKGLKTIRRARRLARPLAAILPCPKTPLRRCVVNHAQPDEPSAKDNVVITKLRAFRCKLLRFATRRGAAGKQQPLLYGHHTSNMTWQKQRSPSRPDETKWTEVS